MENATKKTQGKQGLGNLFGPCFPFFSFSGTAFGLVAFRDEMREDRMRHGFSPAIKETLFFSFLSIGINGIDP